MKNLKRLVALFTMATLFSTSFTSCVDNEVDPAVLAIYENQAELLASQAALNQAEAAFFEAQAAHEEALAALLLAQTAHQEAVTANFESLAAHQALVRVQELMVIEAETAQALATIQQEMALAEQAFANEMAQLLADLAAAGAEIAQGYAEDYAFTMSQIAQLKLTKTQKQDFVAEQELNLELMALGITNAQTVLEGIIADKDAAIAANNASIAAYEAILADPTTKASQVDALNAEIDALEAAADEYNLQITELVNQIHVLYEEWFGNEDLIEEYEDKLEEHDELVEQRDNLIDANEGLQDNIDDWTLALTDYDAALASYEEALADAEAAEAAAETAADDAAAAETAAIEASDDADAAWVAATAALTALQAEIDALEAAFNLAAATLAAEQAAYDAGIGAVTAAVTTAETGVTNAEAALLLAQNNYETWKTIFEANPAGYTWSDPGTDSYAAVLGDQDSSTNVSTPSYVRVLTWENNGVDDNTPETFGTTVVTTLPVVAGVTNEIINNGDYSTVLTDGQYATTYPTVGYTVAYWYEVGADDVAENNLMEFQAATSALGNEDIFDTLPEVGDATSTDTGAWAALWNAQLALLEAEDDLANFGTDLALAQEEYDYQKNLYENELVLLNAAQAAEAAAEAAADAAADAETAAIEASDDADTAFTEAQADTVDAQSDLDTFLSTSEEDLASWIANAEEQIAENNLYIAELQIRIDMWAAEVAELQEAYDALMQTPLNSQAWVDIYQLWDQVWTIEDQMEADTNAMYALQQTINALENFGDYFSSEDIQVMIDGLVADNTTLAEERAQAVADYTLTEAEELENAAYVEMVQRWIDLTNETIEAIDARIAVLEALAAEYKALMEAALAS